MVSSGRDNPDFDSVLCVPIQELVVDEDLHITIVLLFRILLVGVAIQIRTDMYDTIIQSIFVV